MRSYLSVLVCIVLVFSIMGCAANIEQRLQQAQNLINQGQLEQAREDLISMTASRPNNPDAHYLLGNANARLDRYEESIVNYDQAERYGILPTAAFHLDRGVALYHTGRTREAEASFELSIRIQPSGEAQRYLGLIRYRSSDYEGAVHSFERASSLRNDREALPAFGISLLRAGRTVDAVEMLGLAHELVPINDMVTFEAGNAYLLAGQPDQAINMYREVPASSSYALESIYNTGEAYVRLGDFEHAVALFETYLAQRPADHAAAFNLASALVETGEYVIAEELFSELLGIESYRVRAEYNLGLTNFRMGRAAEAALYLSRAIRSDPDNITYRYAYGLALAEAGDLSAAVMQMETILAGAPDNADALAWLERYNRR